MSDVSERAEAMLAKITPGPWGVDSDDYPDDNAVYSDGIERYITERVNNPDDAEFIAAAPDLVAGLLAERDAALSEYESYRAFISECGSDEGAYCEGWAHGYELAHHRLDKYLDERGVESVAELVDSLQAKIDAVLACHNSDGRRLVGFPRADKWEDYCTECNLAAPCATVKALEA